MPSLIARRTWRAGILPWSPIGVQPRSLVLHGAVLGGLAVPTFELSRVVACARGAFRLVVVQSLGDTISSFNLSSFYSPLLSNQAFGTSAEAIEQYLYRGIITWGQPVSTIFEDGMLLIQQARSTDGSGNCILFSVHMDSLDDIWSNRTD